MSVRPMRAVLFIAHRYPPENTSSAPRPFHFAKYLPQFGYSAHVISRSGVIDADKSGSVERVPSQTTFLSKLREGVISRVAPYSADELPWVSHATKAGWASCSRIPFVAIFSTGMLANHLAAAAIQRRTGLKWIADFQDPLLDNPFRSKKLVRPWDACMERRVFRRANYLIGNTEQVGEVWRKRYPQWKSKVHVLMTGYDPEDRVEALPLPQRPYQIILHAGALYGGRRPTAYLQTLRRLVETGALPADGIRGQFVGELSPDALVGAEDTVRWLEERNLLEFVPAMDRAAARRCMATADRLLLLDLNDAGTGLQLPAKVIDYLRVGRPILAYSVRNSAVDQLLPRCDVPHRIIYTDDPQDTMDRKLMEFLATPTHSVSPGDWFLSEFDVRAQVTHLARLLDQPAPQ
jgi:hypothetical protein